MNLVWCHSWDERAEKKVREYLKFQVPFKVVIYKSPNPSEKEQHNGK
jgi:hypothetical protein